MSDLNVIYRIAADISGLESGVKRAAQATEQMQASLQGLKDEILAAFSVNALVAFGREVLDAGDKIQKMADQTGIGIDQVQKLEHIAGQSGTAIESLVGAVQNLQVRLGDENSGAAGAMAQLGIEMESFTKLNGYDQMTLLADAIKDIHDPTEQASLAAALFGKTWKEILPAIKSGMKETGDQATIMADDTVKALDRIGDSMKSLHETAIVVGAFFVTAIENAGFAVWNFISIFDPEHFGRTNLEMLKLYGTLNDPNGLLSAMAKIPPVAKDVGAGLKSVALNAAQAAEVSKDLTRQGEESIKMHEAAAKAAKAHADAIKKFKESVDGLSFKTYIQDLSKLNAIVPDLTAHTTAMAAIFAEARDQIDDLAASDTSYTSAVLETETGVRKLFTAFSTLPNVVAQNTKAIKEAGETIQVSFGDRASDVLGGMIKILRTGRDAFSDFAATAAQGAKTLIDSWKNTHSVFDLVVNAATTAFTLLSKLWSNPEKQVNPVRQAFVDLHGGLATLNEDAHNAGVTLTAMLNAKTPEAYTKAIDDLNAALTFQDDAMKTLNDTVAKYGFTITQLGPAFARQQLDKRAQQLYQDFKVLTAAGLNVDVVLGKMGDSINQFILDARATGSEVPAAMKPMIEHMITMGTLLDENGNAFTDLASTGLTFSETMTQGFNRLIDTVNRLTDAIARGLHLALDNLPPVPSGSPGPSVSPPDVEPPAMVATGGLVTTGGIRRIRWRPQGSDIVPAMLTPGELVLNAPQQAALRAEISRGPSAGTDHAGAGDVHVTFAISTIDASDFQTVVEQKVFPALVNQLRRGRGLTPMQDVLGIR
jgi:uncharacterized coiled-coil protein SlyX